MEYGKAGPRQILTFAVFVLVIGVFFVLGILLPPPDILVSERRVPASFPELSARTILSASFMSKFENYAEDRFPFRDGFRALRAAMVLDLLRQSDKSGIYRDRAVGIGEFRRTDETAFRQTAQKIKRMADSLAGMNVYYSVIPDKSVFADKYMPGYDHSAAERILSEELAGYAYIPLKEQLSADSFYKTDLHWNQVRIAGLTGYLLSAMGANTDMPEWPTITAGAFRGVYAGQLALPVEADELAYYNIPDLKVRYLNEKTLAFEAGAAYEPGRFSGVDPYDIFLRGPQPLIVIENGAAGEERELYLFRDSFGSSLAPLLTGAYSKITLIDLRYIHADLLGQFVEFTPGSDVLFLYGSQILGNPSVLQV